MNYRAFNITFLNVYIFVYLIGQSSKVKFKWELKVNHNFVYVKKLELKYNLEKIKGLT